MKDIVVSSKGRDIECIVKADKEIQEKCKFAIRGLAGIQLLCIQQDSETDPKFSKMIDILSNCVEDIERLYVDETEESDPTEGYGD